MKTILENNIRLENGLFPWEPIIKGTFGILTDHVPENGDICEHCKKDLSDNEHMFSAQTTPCFCSWDCAINHPYNTVIDKGAY